MQHTHEQGTERALSQRLCNKKEKNDTGRKGDPPGKLQGVGRGGRGYPISPVNGVVSRKGVDSNRSILTQPGKATWIGLQDLLTLRAPGTLEFGHPEVGV